MSDKKESGPRLVEADSVEQVAEHTDAAIEQAYTLALSECIDPMGFDPEDMLAQADGTQLSPEQGRHVDAHLAQCMHCKLMLREYHGVRHEHGERLEAEKANAFEALLVEARAASAIGVDTQEGPGPELTLVSPSVLRRIPWSRILPASGFLAAAAVALLMLGSPVESTVPQIEIANLKGTSASVMGTQTDSGPAIYVPDASVNLTVRTAASKDQAQRAPEIFGYFEKHGKLAALPAETMVQRLGDSSWTATEWKIPVRAVLGAQLGPRRLFYAATLSHSPADFVGMTPDEARAQSGVRWVEQALVVAESK